MLADARAQLSGIWNGLGRTQQVTIGIVVAMALIAVVAVAGWASTPEYATAFSNLNEEDAGAIVAKLKETKTPYELANGGTAIRVPAAILYETRLELASAGLPKGGGVGFEIFNQTNFGMTDFAQKVNYQRALEGELSRTINHLGPVASSRVHIVIPQPTLYTDNQKDATASVVLNLKLGQRLKDSQVRGIAQLLSSSVEGLKQDNLTIVDENGNVLWDVVANNNDSYKSSSTQLDRQKAFEADLEQRVQGMLDKVLGSGKATVRAQAMLDWDQVESSSELYSPQNAQPQIRSFREAIERSGEPSDLIGGVPGTRSNLPGYSAIITGTTTMSSTYEKRDTTTNYELSKIVEKTFRAPGKVKKLSVAVILDGPTPADATQIDQVSRLVSAAAGIDLARGDVLAVSSMPFKGNNVAEEAQVPEDAQWAKLLEEAKIAAMIVGPVLLLLVLFFITRRRRPKGLQHIKQIPGATRSQIAGPAVQAALTEGEPKVVALKPDPVDEAAQQRAVLVREHMSALTKTQPEVVVNLIKTWMQEDKR